MNGSRLKITRLFVCKCHYLSVTFAKILIGIKMVAKHKTRKNQLTFYKCNTCNNTINIILYCINTREAAKGIKNIIIAVNGQGLPNNYNRQIQGQTNFINAFVMLKQKLETMNSVMSSQCRRSEVQSPQSYPFSIKYLLQKSYK